jgi:hypothetical protein
MMVCWIRAATFCAQISPSACPRVILAGVDTVAAILRIETVSSSRIAINVLRTGARSGMWPSSVPYSWIVARLGEAEVGALLLGRRLRPDDMPTLSGGAVGCGKGLAEQRRTALLNCDRHQRFPSRALGLFRHMSR